VKDAQRRGVKFGRKPKLTALQIELARKQIERREDRGKVAENFNVNRAKLYRALAGCVACRVTFADTTFAILRVVYEKGDQLGEQNDFVCVVCNSCSPATGAIAIS
jgi:hypothetical protein